MAGSVVVRLVESGSSDWAVVVGTLLGAIVGAAASWLATRRQVAAITAEGEAQRKAAAKEAALQHERERDLARQDRRQHRIEDAYIMLMSFWQSAGEWVTWRMTQLGVADPVLNEFPKPPIDERHRALANLVLPQSIVNEASRCMLSMESFKVALNDFEAGTVEFGEVMGAGADVRDLIEALREAMAADLNDLSSGS
jgi:hypothetical protein